MSLIVALSIVKTPREGFTNFRYDQFSESGTTHLGKNREKKKGTERSFRLSSKGQGHTHQQACTLSAVTNSMRGGSEGRTIQGHSPSTL